MTEEVKKCWIFGDEAGVLGNDRFFAVGIVGTTKPKELIDVLKKIRERTEYFDEVSYKSGNAKRILCSIRWVDWFLSKNNDFAHFKILIKDSNDFDVSYYKDNKYDAGATQLAYCESYKEVLNNFACYNGHTKGFVYSKVGLEKMELGKYLENKIQGLNKEDIHSKHTKEKKKDNSEYTGTAEILQLCDLLTSSTRGLCCSLFGEEVGETWDKNTLRKNIHFHVPDIKDKLSNNKNVYFPEFTQEKQKFVVYKWRGGVKRQNTPILNGR